MFQYHSIKIIKVLGIKRTKLSPKFFKIKYVILTIATTLILIYGSFSSIIVNDWSSNAIMYTENLLKVACKRFFFYKEMNTMSVAQ